jgi:hypothetical protein
MTNRLEAAAAALRAELDAELAMLQSCLAALGPIRRPRAPMPPPRVSRGPREAKVKRAKPVVRDGMAGVTLKRKPGRPRAKTGQCDVCGRAALDWDGRGAVPFHYAPEPCGLVCAGGASIGRPEDRVDGLHSRLNCPRCNRTESKMA